MGAAERRVEDRARRPSGSWRRWRAGNGNARREEALAQRELDLRAREAEIDRLAQEQRGRLERIAGLTAEDARREILQRVEDEARTQAARWRATSRSRRKRGADRDARRIIAMAIQRLAAEHTAETTVAAVALPNDEMKGRIIGREGRNIRAFETATGVDVIIDDTPDTVIVSCFDPIRREVARRSLEALIRTVASIRAGSRRSSQKSQQELEAQLIELGEQAAYEPGSTGSIPS